MNDDKKKLKKQYIENKQKLLNLDKEINCI